MLNLNSTIDLDFKQFFRWWKRELRFLVPEKLKQLVNVKEGFIIVRPDGNQLELTYELNGQTEFLARLDRNEFGADQYKALKVTDERIDKATIIIRLARQDGIQKELALPAAAKGNLYQVASYELDRYTPFKENQVYFAVKPLDVVNEPGQIRIKLVIATREFLDTLCEDITAMGMVPLFADYEDAPNTLEQNYGYYNLLRDILRQRTRKTPRLIYSALITSVCILLAAVITLPVWFEYRAVKALELKTAALEKDARKVKALQSDIDAVIDETRQLIDEKNAKPPVIEMLNVLSMLIKDDTWLSYAQYSDGHLQIQGESPAASTMIAVLEASELFANARFVSPVTQDSISKLERFQITVDVTKAGGIDGK
jgi:general secretion pathway protein L